MKICTKCHKEKVLSEFYKDSGQKSGLRPSWDNYGAWHIDHRRPCASFDLSDLNEQRKCFHFSNLQPLWAIDNIHKGNKYNAK